ncbi:MAG: ELM1/GtrOC1 family putative glycosyltransferase [Candidatus Omnitrophica bacterium]|nr:ELM1/GtrOC1 family putative glycosyltransferase [Candidatus Omnitrophota bacterium]
MNLSGDYFLYILLKSLSGVFMLMPVGCAIFTGALLGRLGYYLDRRHRNAAYKNLRIAFASSKEPAELQRILKGCFVNICLSFVEMLRLPKVDKRYLERFVTIEGREYFEECFRQGRGLIILASHFGNWELAMSMCSAFGYPFSVIVQEQRKSGLLNELLNDYRKSKGYKLIPVDKSAREAMADLKAGRVLGIVADHGGGREGSMIEFFSRPASTPQGAVKLAQRLNVPIIMVHVIRRKGAYHKVVLSPPLRLATDVDENLRMINRYIESYVGSFPNEYLWFYKRWKYSTKRDALILSDGKQGHLNQSEAVLKAAGMGKRQVVGKIAKVEYKNLFMKFLFYFLVFLSGFGRICRVFILKSCLKKECYKELIHYYADMVVSCGSSLAGVNLLISKENGAKSVAVMRPGVFSPRRFDLVIAPKHDRLSGKLKNIVVTEGALNTIDDSTIQEAGRALINNAGLNIQPDRKYLGILLGGDAKDYGLNIEAARDIFKALKSFCEKNGWEALLTTSRRTSKDIENLVKDEFAAYPRCRLLIIANEKNIEGAVPGILALSSAVIVSPESISMISEAASSGKPVFVFDAERIRDKRHRRFLDNLKAGGYISDFNVANITEHSPKVLRDLERVRGKIVDLLV